MNWYAFRNAALSLLAIALVAVVATFVPAGSLLPSSDPAWGRAVGASGLGGIHRGAGVRGSPRDAVWARPAFASVVPEPLAVFAGVAPEPLAVFAGVAPEPLAVFAGVAPVPGAVPAGVSSEPRAALAGVAPEPGVVLAGVAPEPVAVLAGVAHEGASVLAGVAPGAALPGRAPGSGFRPPVEPPLHVTRRFDAPPRPWLPGHRGVDLASTPGATVWAAGPGEVVFAGPVAGRSVVTIQHAGGLRTTYEPLIPVVRRGDQVAAGDPLGMLDAGHSGCPVAACLHWGLRRGADYLDPLLLLGFRVRLLPL